ncbi:energy-coupling factor ABC transporter permease [Glaciecola sp. KUL10]|uniref:energy-coupling factor ABC transporter permease n=1 Tax=Glaciecola sp. (strain KUL10) TaxID=2161813 RepID=UPI000D782205|nr:energy-coupling factor ABC transporter permease [Glaciecola sp. KUL10]
MTTLQILGVTFYSLILLLVLRNTAFSTLVADKHFQHRLFGACAIIFILWVLRVGIVEGLYVHFLWLTALSLIFGFRWAIIGGSFVLLGATAVGFYSANQIGINGLFGVVFPICLSYFILSISFHKMSKHIFVYIFICAFLAGGVCIALKMVAQGVYYYFDIGYEWDDVYNNFLKIIPLVVFPEALFNGMIMTLLIIYKPNWVYTYHDKFYLDKK